MQCSCVEGKPRVSEWLQLLFHQEFALPNWYPMQSEFGWNNFQQPSSSTICCLWQIFINFIELYLLLKKKHFETLFCIGLYHYHLSAHSGIAPDGCIKWFTSYPTPQDFGMFVIWTWFCYTVVIIKITAPQV